MGKASDLQGPKTWKALGSAAGSLAKTHKAQSAAVAILGQPTMDPSSNLAAIEAISSGALMGTYDDFRFKSKGKASVLQTLEIIDMGNVEPAVAKAVAMTMGQVLTKQLVSAPPNTCTPTFLAETAAGEYGVL
jgi:leucyl aminopeptidase